jgi:hypothetical protein
MGTRLACWLPYSQEESFQMQQNEEDSRLKLIAVQFFSTALEDHNILNHESFMKYTGSLVWSRSQHCGSDSRALGTVPFFARIVRIFMG